MIIHTCAYPRAALIGNPSDGFFGKTIAFTFRNFAANITLYETPELDILPSTRDHSRFADIRRLANDVNKYGYYGGIRLLKATIKRFHDYCEAEGIALDDRNFTVRYHTSIPPHLGLAGSSAIITATFRALLEFYGIEIPKPVLPNIILSVETEELGIPAGLQDRVAQVYDAPVFMDFDQATMERQGYGLYEEFSPALLPPLYIAYRTELSEGSEITHSNLRYRYDSGEPDVRAAMEFWADLTIQVLEKLKRGDTADLGQLLDANFDKRREICPISEGNLKMIEAARATGASAKFTGSGGAIIGTYKDEEMFENLVKSLDPLGINVIKPEYQ
jgi:glucuronokinase